MFFESFKTVGSAVGQIIFLGALGYFLVKRKIISSEGLDNLSRLSIDVTLPFLIVYQLVKDFSFSRYPNWWLFPLLSLIITVVGLAAGWIFSRRLSTGIRQSQFISLVGFQNSGYLPLALFASLVPAEMRGSVLIYLFLFMAGFNLTMFSVGPCFLTASRGRKINPRDLLNAPVIAVVLGLLLVWTGIDRFVPSSLLRSMKMVGDCTLPLALFVVGGSLAGLYLKKIDYKAIGLLVAAKLVFLPAIALLLIRVFGIPQLIGMFILVQLAVPSAVTLSALVRQYRQDDVLISQGILLTHLASVLTLPVFLSVYFTYYMV